MSDKERRRDLRAKLEWAVLAKVDGKAIGNRWSNERY
jgi:hypothetical protein